jgi:heme oxygenase
LIRSDLADLGETPSAVDSPRSLDIDGAAAAFGVRYVIEGSALGGAVLARTVQQALGADAPTRYLNVHGSELGARWRAFMAELAAWDKSATSADKTRACDTARAVFACYRAAFERNGALAVASAT